MIVSSRFVALIGLMAALGAAPVQARPGTPRAEVVILNARVRTMDPARPDASAVAIARGRILAVGSRAAMLRLAGPRTRRVDAHGQVVLPGFVDVHMHPRPDLPEMSRYGTLDLSPEAGVRSVAGLLAKVSAKARTLPEGGVIKAMGYNESALGGEPALAELDRAAQGHPLVMTHVSGHRLVANSAALTRAGVTATTPDPAGGQFVHAADGALTGVVLERAMDRFSAFSGWSNDLNTLPAAALDAGYRREFRRFLSYGLTGVSDAAANPASLAIYRRLLRSGLPVTVYALTMADQLDWLIAHRITPEWQVPGLTMRAVKIFAGNSLSGHTALLYAPYADDPANYGAEPALQPGPLNALVGRVQAAGLQAAIHANGDREIDRVLDAYALARAAAPAEFAARRNRIEHASITNAGIIARVKALDLCLAPHSYILNLGPRLDAFGAARFDWIEPNRRALDAGICIGGNSDHPVSPPQVMMRVESLVTRRARSTGRVYGPDQRLTPHEALAAFTTGSAYLQFEERERGSLTPGKRADLVMLEADPETVAPDRIGAIRVMQTWVAGRPVYRRTGAREWFAW